MSKSERQSQISCLSLFVSLILLFTLSTGYALNLKQTQSPNEENSWKYHSEVKGVKIYYQINTCNNRGVVYLKFDNTNKEKVKISWKETFQTKQIPEEREGNTGVKELELIPGETYQSNCDQIKVKECIVFSEIAIPTYRADIIKINLKNINVTTS